MDGVTTNTARRVRGGPDLPAACSFKDVFIKSGAAAGFYICLSSNVWTGPFDVSSDSGDVVGPASSTDNALARYDLTTGKLLQNSLVTTDDSGSVNIPTGQTYKINNVALPQQAAVDAKANDADVVHDTGDETIAGVKTFSSDPLIPDEAYGVGWNGSLEPPTKNAVYDKVETLGGGGPIELADVTDVTATATEVNKLSGVGAVIASGTTVTGFTNVADDAETNHALEPTYDDAEVEAALDALGVRCNQLALKLADVIVAIESFKITESA